MAAVLSSPTPATPETFKLRADLTVQRQVQNGEISFIVKDPGTRKYFRFLEAEHAILSRLDGETPLSDILAQVQGQFPHLGITARDLATFLASLKKADLLERSAAEKNLLLLERLRDQRQNKLRSQANPLAKALYLHYHLVDPDRFFDRVLPRVRWIWSRPFITASLLLFVVGAWLNLRNLGEIAQGIVNLYRFTGYQWHDYVLLYGLSLGVIVLHEFGHGMTCKHHGGEVHDLGFLLIFFNPAMYCNVSDAYLFENRRHKLYVTAAGGFVELWIWAVASIFWAATLPGTDLHELAFFFMVVSGVSTLAFNFNPLMKLDGYYALVDLLGVANLRDRSFEYVRTWLKRNVFQVRVPPLALDARLERIFAVYGTLAVAYSGLMLVVMFFLFKNLILGKLHLAGLPFFLLLVYMLYGSLVKKALAFLRNWAESKRDTIIMQPRFKAGAALAGVALLAAFVLVGAPVRVLEDFTLEPGAKLAVHPSVGGRVLEVRVREGQAVKRGDVVGTLANPDIEKSRIALEARRREEETALASARYAGDLAELAASEARLGEVDAALFEARADIASLTLRAPIDGIVLTERPTDRVGDQLAPADSLVEIGDLTRLGASIDVVENEVGEVARGQKVGLVFHAFPGRTFEGEVQAISALARPGKDPGASRQVARFGVAVMVPNPDGLLRPGMSGEAKIFGDRRPLYRLALHWAGKTFNPDFW